MDAAVGQRRTGLAIHRASLRRSSSRTPINGDSLSYTTRAPDQRRTVRFRLGPTNSGKTHDAFEALKRAPSGVYLAPLRLLAMEIRDRLVAQGIPCNLLTGEEHDLMEGARHTACSG